MLIETPIAVLKNSENKEKANQFIRFTKSVTAQRIWAEYGLPPGQQAGREGVPGRSSRRGTRSTRSPTRSSAAGRRPTRSGSTRAARSWSRSRGRSVAPPASAAAAPALRHPAAPSERAGTALSLGFVTLFLTLIVLLPMAALMWESQKEGAQSFWDTVSSPQSVAALKLTLGAAFVVALINAVLGTITAWVLVRDDFRGQGHGQRDHRPAVRPADDRRGPDAARALRAGVAGRDRHRASRARRSSWR